MKPVSFEVRTVLGKFARIDTLMNAIVRDGR